MQWVVCSWQYAMHNVNSTLQFNALSVSNDADCNFLSMVHLRPLLSLHCYVLKCIVLKGLVLAFSFLCFLYYTVVYYTVLQFLFYYTAHINTFQYYTVLYKN